MLGIVALLWFGQDSLIYIRRTYLHDVVAQPPAGCTALRFRTAQGEQVAFYRAPSSGMAPLRLWCCFGGNGALALQWLSVVDGYPDAQAGFLFIDYPGYGACAGSPSPATILESSDAALVALAAQLQETPVALAARCCVLGHSLGSGAALQFAVRHPIQAAVLVAPFTSLRDMARRSVGWPLCGLLKGDFDNRMRLAELCARPQPPALAILHGDRDEVIPVEMGRALAAQAGVRVRFDEVAGADHNGLVVLHRERLWKAMLAAR